MFSEADRSQMADVWSENTDTVTASYLGLGTFPWATTLGSGPEGELGIYFCPLLRLLHRTISRCLYFKAGSGKSINVLCCMFLPIYLFNVRQKIVVTLRTRSYPVTVSLANSMLHTYTRLKLRTKYVSAIAKTALLFHFRSEMS